MITSKRKFGIEIEFSAPTKASLLKIHSKINVTRDGSLDNLPNAGEYVSDILQGDKGYKVLESVCDVLKKNGAEASATETSIHVHLDGLRGDNQLRSSRMRPTNLDFNRTIVYGISRALVNVTTEEEIMRGLRNNSHPLFGDSYQPSHFDSIYYYSKAQLSRAPILNYTYYWLERNDRFKWLQNVFYFYTLFSDVMEDIVSNSRKFGNMYCIPLGVSYDLPTIAAAKNEKELKNVWYKGRSPNGHYDDSRYHNVNLHCFWDRHGTVEIRSHGGTIDAGKIALWVMLHQAIVDKLEDTDIETLIAISKDKDANLYREFLNFIEDGVLQAYVKRLLGYYSNINIK